MASPVAVDFEAKQWLKLLSWDYHANQETM